MSAWSVHCCLFDPICRLYGAPSRLHINTPRGHLTIAFRPGDRVIGTRWWWPIHWRPARSGNQAVPYGTETANNQNTGEAA